MIEPGAPTDKIRKCDLHDERELQINDLNTAIKIWIFLIGSISLLNTYSAAIDLKVANKHSRISCAISTKLRTKTPE